VRIGLASAASIASAVGLFGGGGCIWAKPRDAAVSSDSAPQAAARREVLRFIGDGSMRFYR
jgi:hypothetical protein